MPNKKRRRHKPIEKPPIYIPSMDVFSCNKQNGCKWCGYICGYLGIDPTTGQMPRAIFPHQMLTAAEYASSYGWRCVQYQNAGVALRNVPEEPKGTTSGEGGSTPTPSLQIDLKLRSLKFTVPIPAEDLWKVCNLLRELSKGPMVTWLQRSLAHTAANVLEIYLKEEKCETA